jgi:hypothetical protein
VHDDRLEELAGRLDALAEDLADLAIDRLRAATGEEDPAPAVAEERRVTRARRAVEKAAALLRDSR